MPMNMTFEEWLADHAPDGYTPAAVDAYEKYELFLRTMAARGSHEAPYSPQWFHEVAQSEEMRRFDEKAQQLRQSFVAQFGPEQIAAMTGRELLTKLFYSDVENKDHLCYTLEFRPDMREFFGSITGGSAFKFGLFYHKTNHCWTAGSSRKPQLLTQAQAIEAAVSIRDALVQGAQIIRAHTEFDTPEGYEALEKKLRHIPRMDNQWVMKYYQMLFPDIFPVFYSDKFHEKILGLLKEKPAKTPYVRMGQIAVFTRKCGVSGPVLGKILGDTYFALDPVKNEEAVDALGDRTEGPAASREEMTEHDDDNGYTEAEFLRDVYMAPEAYGALVELIRTKRNVILQGAPGVGKTFAAKRLAYSMMGTKDQSRVAMVQFHQSYSYEDFIMGFRPCENGFTLKTGVFYDFCKRAEADGDNEYFFIIDEINRGNLSKIFGELFMLIESDKRGIQLQLLYSDGNEKFAVPKNVYIIGMMNTADRSLAMLDYALRRRFAFYEMRPGFDTEGFREYRTALASDKFNALVRCVESLNAAISEDDSLGDGFCIGHSYFCNLTAGAVTDRKLAGIVNYELIPLIKEYWFDEPLKVKDWSDKLRGAIT